MRSISLLSSAALFAAAPAFGAAVVTTASGANPAAITPARDAFRAQVGGGNVAGANGSFGGVRREINWDGVPDAFASPNNLPANFFNANSPRGVVFSTPGTGIRVSANAGNSTGTPVEFGEISADYPPNFQPFSPQRLFGILGSNIVDVNFFVPGTTTAAYVTSFAAIFTDAETAGSATIQFFDLGGTSLGVFEAALSDSEGLSFLGVRFDAGERIGRVRITAGTAGLDQNCEDCVAMDDFLYAEPLAVNAVPEPASWALMIGGFAMLGWRARRRVIRFA